MEKLFDPRLAPWTRALHGSLTVLAFSFLVLILDGLVRIPSFVTGLATVVATVSLAMAGVIVGRIFLMVRKVILSKD